MTRKEIERLNRTAITRKQFEEIKEHEEVEKIKNNGSSGSKLGTTWYTVYFTDGQEIDIYFYQFDI